MGSPPPPPSSLSFPLPPFFHFFKSSYFIAANNNKNTKYKIKIKIPYLQTEPANEVSWLLHCFLEKDISKYFFIFNNNILKL
jgi:hypothetical protein